jgi:hypothetical protein
MSDDEADPELLELLRQSLGIGGPKTDEISTDTGTFGGNVWFRDLSLRDFKCLSMTRPVCI